MEDSCARASSEHRDTVFASNVLWTKMLMHIIYAAAKKEYVRLWYEYMIELCPYCLEVAPVIDSSPLIILVIWLYIAYSYCLLMPEKWMNTTSHNILLNFIQTNYYNYDWW